MVPIQPDYNLLNDAYLGDITTFCSRKLPILAKMAQPEKWNFDDPKYQIKGNPYIILYNYINFTYDRLKQEGKIAVSSEEDRMCFNTGLQTTFEEDIYAYFMKNRYFPETSEKPWYLVKFCKRQDRELTIFSPLPPIAEYIEDARDLIFDKKLLPIRIRYEHIIEDNIERFKEIRYENQYELTQRLEKAVSRAEERVKRNYKIAIPQFFTDKRKKRSGIQLLLPICITNPINADLALVVDREENAYTAKTVVPLDWAYMNARRLTKPDSDWIFR